MQDKLDRLPVPDLTSTMTKYLRSVRPLLTQDEYMSTAAKVQQFCDTDGQRLQHLLLERAAAKENCK